MTIQGRIKEVFPTATYGSTQIRDCIVTTDDKYPQEICVKFFKDKCGLLDKYREGSQVSIAYNLRGNSYKDKNGNTKYSTDIVGWKIESAGVSNNDQQPDREDLPF